MRFDHPEYHTKKSECWFELSDSWTVRTVLDYDAAIVPVFDNGLYVRLWNALSAVVDPEKWHCEVPLDLSLDEVHDKKTIEIIQWASLAGFSARRSMDADRKN
jgi:hypothetical protein